VEADREKWNERYRGDDFQMGLAPSPFLAENVELILASVPGRKALDIACGEGRNAIFLASRGFDVTAVDISDTGLEKGRKRAEREGVTVDFVRADLEDYAIEGKYDLVANINFLLRGLIPQGVEALNPGGIFLFDTILDSPKLPGKHNPLYLLGHGELRRLFEGYTGSVLRYEEREEDSVPTAKLIFRKE
jgi:tellurite methyltransferase